MGNLVRTVRIAGGNVGNQRIRPRCLSVMRFRNARNGKREKEFHFCADSVRSRPADSLALRYRRRAMPPLPCVKAGVSSLPREASRPSQHSKTKPQGNVLSCGHEETCSASSCFVYRLFFFYKAPCSCSASKMFPMFRPHISFQLS